MRKAMLTFYGMVPRGMLNTGWHDDTPVPKQEWLWLDGGKPDMMVRRRDRLVHGAKVGDIWQFEYSEWAGEQAHGAGWTPVKKEEEDVT